MKNYKLAKKLLSLAIALLMLSVSVFPAMAISGMPENQETPLSQEQKDQSAVPDNRNSITVPLTFDGSMPDASQIVVKNSDPVTAQMRTFGSAEPNNSQPRSVETKMKRLDGKYNDIKMITADIYQKFIPNGETGRIYPFYTIISGNIPEGGNIGVSFCETEDVQSSNGENYTLTNFANEGKTCDKGTYYLSIKDTYSLMDGADTKDFYITIWKLNGSEKVYLYQSERVTIRYMDNETYNTTAYATDKYLSINAMDSYLSVKTPYMEDVSNKNVELKLIDSNGIVVGKSLNELNPVSTYLENGIDNEYNAVFGQYHNIKTNYQSFNGRIYRANEWNTGLYGIKIAVDGIDVATYDNVIEIVDGVVIEGLWTNLGGYPPVQEGDKYAYIELRAEKVNKDDFTISIKDIDGNIIGRSTESRYSESDSFIYKVALDGNNTFLENNEYFIECVSDKPLYYNSDDQRMYVSEEWFDVYDLVQKGDKAEFTLRAVNPPEGTVTAELIRRSSGEEVSISSKLCNFEEVTTLRFDDDSGNILSLDAGEYVLSFTYVMDSTPFEDREYFYVYSNNNEQSRKVQYMHNPFFYITDTRIPFDIAISKQAYNITESTQFDVILKDKAGNIIGTADDNMVVSDTIITNWNNKEKIDSKKLSGTISVNEGIALEEGLYSIIVVVGGKDEIKNSISCITSEKIYAISSYPAFEIGDSGISIDGYVYMLKKDKPYDVNKFSYSVTDLMGNPVSVSKPSVEHYDYDYSYQDYYEIDSAVNSSIPAAYYRLSLQYDGKDIYDIDKPSDTILEGYSSIDVIPVQTELSSWYGYDTGIYGAEFSGKMNNADIVTALIYDPDNKVVFSPIKTIALTRSIEITNLYALTSNDLIGLEADKEYLVVILLNGNFMSSYESILAARDEKIIPVTGIGLFYDSIDLKVDESKQLETVITPANATNKKVAWSSSNTAIATVDSNGNITGIGPGTAVITATTEDGGIKISCNVKVSANVATLTIDKLTYGDEAATVITAAGSVYNVDGAKYPLDKSIPLRLTLNGTRYNAAKDYDYAISINNQVPFKSGSYKGADLLNGLTLDLVRDSKQADGNYIYKVVITEGTTQVASLSFTLAISGTPIPVNGVSINKETVKIEAGQTSTLRATITPSNATNKKVTWTSSDPMVAAVDPQTGAVTAVGAGGAVITATTEDGGKTDTCIVDVTIGVAGTLKYGSEPARGVWVSLFRDNDYMAGKYTDADGKFNIAGLTIGSYKVQAYSGDKKYISLNQQFDVEKNDTSITGVNGFFSIYNNTTDLTIKVDKKSEGGAIGSPYQVGVYNYEAGVSEWVSDDGSSDTIVFEDIPYLEGGTEYYVYLCTGQELGYYYDSRVITANSAPATCNFEVPVTYSIKGSVRDNFDMPVIYTSVTADNGAESRWVYTDQAGNFTIFGLYNDDYTVSIDDYRYATTSAAVTVSGPDTMPVNLVVQKGMTLTGRAHKDGIPANKAYVYLTDGSGNWVANGYSTGSDGFAFEGAIKAAGTYKLHLSSVYDGRAYQNFVSEPVDITVTNEDIAKGRMRVDVAYSNPVSKSQIFTGSGNNITTDIGVVHSGSNVNLVVKYKNNGNTPVDAEFTAELPNGVTVADSNKFSISGLQAGKSGQQTIGLLIGDSADNYLNISVKVKMDGLVFDFGTAGLEVANITINAPGAVKPVDKVKVYGEATAGSTITVKNAVTGEVLGSAVPNGRWYSAELRSLPEGTYDIVAEAVNGTVTAKSSIIRIESKANQITINKVIVDSYNSSDLPVNGVVGVRAFTAWVGSDLNGHDIDLAVLFDNNDSISNVTYHFSDMSFTATRGSNGYWKVILTGWSGGGLKTITATVNTTDGRTLTYIIAEVTILIDPSGIVKDAETGEGLAGVTMICEVLNGSTWEQWNAELYGQINPQITDANGNYGWMVPAGTYRVRAFKEGYGADMKDNIVIPPVRTDVDFELTPSVLVSGIELDKSSASVTEGGNITITATVTPSDAVNAGNIKWTSSNTSVATVNNGVVSGVSEGTAVISAKAGSKTAKCTVTVNKGSSGTDNGGGDSGGGGGGGGLIPAGPVGPVIEVLPANTNPEVKADSTGKASVGKDMLENVEKLTVKAEVEMIFDKTAVGILKNSKADLEISVTKADTSKLSAEARKLVGNRPAYEFNIKADGKAITDMGGGLVSIKIPYTLKADEDPDAIVIYSIGADGKASIISGGIYDPQTKSVTFKTSHFSVYAIGYNKKEFTDVPGWAADYVSFLAAREITNGKGEGKFGSTDNITRGEFVTLLARIAGVDLSKYSASGFTDVDSGAFYAGAVGWASENGITKGTGDNKFSPKASITRQEMAVMILNFAKAVKFELPKINDKAQFADNDKISSYAVEAAYALQQAGIIEGRTSVDAAGKAGRFFAPKDNATRAEIAKILTLVIKGMAK